MAIKLSEQTAKRLAEIQAEIKVLADETIDETTHAEESKRSAAMDENTLRTEMLTAEFAETNKKHQANLNREKNIDEVMRAAVSTSNWESGDGTRRGPEVIRKVNPFEDDVEFRTLARSASRPEDINFDAEPTISRAHHAVDAIPKFLEKTQRESALERLHELLDREDDRNTPLIARHILLTGSPEYRLAFKEYVQAMGRYIPEQMRTAMSLTAGQGGVLVPHYLDPTIIITNAGVYGGTIRSLATIRTIAVKQWEGVTSAGVTAEWTGEATNAADASPSFTSPIIVAKKADAWITGSYEVFEDTGFSTDLSRLLGDAKTRLEEIAFGVGNTGASQPRGVVAAVAAITASIVTSATTGAFVRGDIDSVNNAINPRQEANMAWLANKSIYSKIRAFDTAGGSAFWANLVVGQPPILMGAPALKSFSMSNAVAAGNNVLLAGDFSQYYIIDRIGMSVIYDPLVKSTSQAPTGSAGWYAHWRVGGDVVNADAFRLLQLNGVTASFTALG